ncbi:MAG: DKNYY domain-containing protein [Aquaticitalea sp.]
MKKLFAIVIILTFCACSPKYDKRDGKVYYKCWSFGLGGWNESIVEKADHKSFSKIKSNHNLYGKDKSNVYYQNRIIPGADPKTFKHVKDGYAIDKNRAYYFNDSIMNSSPKNFHIIDGYYSKDHQNVFYTDKALNVCAVKDFSFVYKDEESFLGRWSTDGCCYYFNNYKVPSEDYKNIQLFKGGRGVSKDSKQVYLKDQIYSVTEERKVYIRNKGFIVKDTIDIETFTVENHMLMDKFGRIN